MVSLRKEDLETLTSDETLAAPTAVLAEAEALEQQRSRSARSDFYPRFAKRAVDIALGAVLLLLFSPLILAAAAAVVLSSGWPPFYLATRVGMNGRPFRMVKVRTMRKDADRQLQAWLATDSQFRDSFQHQYKVDFDPRKTAVGKLLRRTSIDELPQLLNVVKGDMSLVGPRPIVTGELENYGDFADRFLSVRPGITGLWQVSGRNEITYPQRARLELQYVSSVSFSFDMRMLVLTAFALLRVDGR